MRSLFKKFAAVGILVFLFLWVVGIVRGLSLPYPQPPAWRQLSSGDSAWKSTLPSANNLRQLGLSLKPLPRVLDEGDVERIRIHEKSAQLATGSAAFAEDSGKIRSMLAKYNATVFNERSSDVVPNRRLSLEIGVRPNEFDGLVEELRQIGHLDSISVQKRDRTDEFRRLYAQRQSQKKHLQSILKLRAAKDASIDDQLKVEQKIQDIERELHGLSARFGDLLGKDSFYHVKITLFEYQPGGWLDRSYTVPQRIMHAFFWALTWWCAAAVVAGALVAAFLSIQALRPSFTLRRRVPSSGASA